MMETYKLLLLSSNWPDKELITLQLSLHVCVGFLYLLCVFTDWPDGMPNRTDYYQVHITASCKWWKLMSSFKAIGKERQMGREVDIGSSSLSSNVN